MVKALPPGPGSLVPTGPTAPELYYEQVPSGGKGKPSKKGMKALPGFPQENLENGETTDTGSQARNLDRIVNGGDGNGGNGGNGGPRHHTTFYGPPANGNGNGNGGSKKSKKKGPGRISTGLGGVGKGILKGIYEHRPGYGRRQEEVLARPRAEKIAQEQFGITEDTTELTYYQQLGVMNTASSEQIKQAYDARVKIIYPEVDGRIGTEKTPESEEAMRILNEIKSVLLDAPQPQRRNAYDKSLLKPGSYEGMTPGMRKRAMKQARTGMKYEQDIKSEAYALGIPLTVTKPGIAKQVSRMTKAERRGWAESYGVDPSKLDDDKKLIEDYGTLFAQEETRTVSRSVQELAQAIQVQKGTLQTQKTYLAEAEDEYKELRPSKRVKASRAAGKAVRGVAGGGAGLVGGLAQLSGKAIETSGRSGIGREVRGQGSSNLGSLRDIQSPALGAIRRAGAGGVKRRQGALKVQSPFGRLPVTGKPAVRKRKKGF